MTYSPYGVCLALGVGALLLLMALTGKRFGLPKGAVACLGALGIPMAFLCARLVYCLVDVGYFTVTISQPVKMLAFWDGGYSLLGAGLGLSLAAWLTARIMKCSPGAMLDSLFTFLGAALLAERLGERYTLLGLGREVQSAWLRELPFFAVEDSGGYLCHAVYRYEAAAALVVLGIMLALAFGGKRAKSWPKGDLALVAVSLYGCVQVVLESMRDDGHMMWGFVRANQVFAVFLPAAALILFTLRGIRARGRVSWQPAVLWLTAAGAIALGIIKEFDIDTSTNLWMDYGVMALALGVMLGTVLAAHAWERRLRQS